MIAILFALALAIPKTDATVGVAAIDLDTGRTVSVRGDEAFPMASVFKFPLAITVLHRFPKDLDRKYTIQPAEFSPGHSPIRDRANGKPVTLTLRELVIAAVSDSDNTAGDYLLRLVTPAAVNERMRAMHAEGVVVDRTEGSIIRSGKFETGNHSTPLAMAGLLGIFDRKPDALLMQAMTQSANPVRIGKLLPKGCVVAHKTGTMPGIMNDVGLITSPDRKHHIAIAIFTKGGTKSSDASREDVVAQVAKNVYDQLTR